MKAALLYVVVALLMVLYLMLGHNGIVKYNSMVDIEEEYKQELTDLDIKIAETKREIELIEKNGLYLDYIIKKDLGLQQKDEDQYILPYEPVQRR